MNVTIVFRFDVSCLIERDLTSIGVARGCTCTPSLAKKKNGRGHNLQGKVESAPPDRAKSQIFEDIVLGRIDLEEVGSRQFSGLSLCFEGDD